MCAKKSVICSGPIIGSLAQDVTFNPLNENDDILAKLPIIGPLITLFFSHTLISRGTNGKNKGNGLTKIGSNNMFLGKSHIGHDVVASMIGGHAEIEDYAHIGGATAVHQHCKIGAYAMVGSMILLKKDVLPFFLVAGNPVLHYKLNTVALKRQNFSVERMQILEQAQKILRFGIQSSLESLPQNEDITKLIESQKNSSKYGIYRFLNPKKK